MTKDFKKISLTAVIIAYFRAKYTDMPFAKKIYDKISKLQNPSVLEKITPFLAWVAKFFPGSFERLSSLEGRYMATNEAISRLGKDIAVIEVASGLSSRSLEWADKNFIYIETDLPEILENKKLIFKEISEEEKIKQNPNHIFLSLNVIKWEEWENIGKKYFANKDEKIAIIHEGLVPYFSKDEQVIFRNNIKKFLENYSPNGVWITPDFTLPKKMNEGWIIKFSKKIIENDTKRKFNHFKNHQEVIEFLRQGSLVAEILDNYSVLEKLTCVPKLKLDKEKVKETLERYRVYVIRLNN